MLFSSVTFLFFFLPTVVFLYYIAAKKYRNTVLLIASLVFYAWGNPKSLLILFLTIVVNYLCGLAVEKAKNLTKHRPLFLTGMILCGGILVDLGVLYYFKYLNFSIQNYNLLSVKFGLQPVAMRTISMPLGISFLTFQGLAYIIDIYRGKTPALKSFPDFALYLSLFPKAAQGPIVRYADIAAEMEGRQETFRDLTIGVRRCIIGLFKKIVIANTLGAVADRIFNAGPGMIDISSAWVGAAAYTLQIFFDFSGYTDMAIGIGNMFGFHFTENFNYPYISKSIREFWRRWHISLSSWFRDYLYIPLGGNRISPVRTYVNLFIVFLATGIWHGANWTFILWGVWNGVFIVLERTRLLDRILGKAGLQWGGPSRSFFAHIYAMLAVLIGWVLFRSDSIQAAVGYLKVMFHMGGSSISLYSLPAFLNGYVLFIFAIAIIFSTPIARWLSERVKSLYPIRYAEDCGLIGMLFYSVVTMATSTYNPFIYFRF